MFAKAQNNNSLINKVYYQYQIKSSQKKITYEAYKKTSYISRNIVQKIQFLNR